MAVLKATIVRHKWSKYGNNTIKSIKSHSIEDLRTGFILFLGRGAVPQHCVLASAS